MSVQRRKPATGGPERRIVVFVDIRGFTRLSARAEHQAVLPGFLHAFYADLDARVGVHALDAYGRHHLKPLGDGAMLLLAGAHRPTQMLERLLAYVLDVEARFQQRLRRTNREHRLHLAAALGWGLSRGVVAPVTGSLPSQAPGAGTPAQRRRRVLDHFGACINLAKRLCDKARPSGVCIDQAAFPALPDHPAFPFRRRTLKGLKGIAETFPVWFCRVAAVPPRSGAAP